MVKLNYSQGDCLPLKFKMPAIQEISSGIRTGNYYSRDELPRSPENQTLQEILAENAELRAQIREHEVTITQQQLEIESLRERVISVSQRVLEGYQEPRKITIARGEWGEAVLDLKTGEIDAPGSGSQKLTPSERDILLAVFNSEQSLRSNQIDQIISRARGEISIPGPDGKSAIRWHIKNIRRKLEAVVPGLSERLETVGHQWGYRWRSDEE